MSPEGPAVCRTLLAALFALADVHRFPRAPTGDGPMCTGCRRTTVMVADWNPPGVRIAPVTFAAQVVVFWTQRPDNIDAWMGRHHLLVV